MGGIRVNPAGGENGRKEWDAQNNIQIVINGINSTNLVVKRGMPHYIIYLNAPDNQNKNRPSLPARGDFLFIKEDKCFPFTLVLLFLP